MRNQSNLLLISKSSNKVFEIVTSRSNYVDGVYLCNVYKVIPISQGFSLLYLLKLNSCKDLHFSSLTPEYVDQFK